MMSTVTPMVTEPPAAARAGADLREARERLGLSLQDIAFNLRIRLPHLEALEEGRISLLPGNAYALAFVRTYANALGLDAEEMVDAALAGFDAKELVTIPSLENQADYEAYAAARMALRSKVSLDRSAARYGVRTPQPA